jgi:hypothetical protein
MSARRHSTLHPTTSNKRAAILDASYRANRAADALRYLDSAVGSAGEAGLSQEEMDCGMLRDSLTRQLEADAEIAGFKASEFYSKE